MLSNKWFKWRLYNKKSFLISKLLIAFLSMAFSPLQAATEGLTSEGAKETYSLSKLEEFKITGTVYDADKIPMAGVNILEKGTMNGVITDLDGHYSITVGSANAVLVFSFIGYIDENITIGNQRSVDITLIEDIQALDEVVVVGYGVQKKTDVTGAMISVDAEALNERPVSNAFEALQGRAAGVDITNSDRPGELGSITIRGVRSLTASSDPLYVVDGVPLMSESAIETLNPRDIESIDILKDASATAIYGSRGANGVIIVTTKKGKAGQYSLNYSGTVTFENIVDVNPSMNASDYITWRRWAYYNSDPENYPRGDEPNYDIDKEIFYDSYGADGGYAWANIEKGWENGTWDGSKVTSTDFTDYVTRTGVTQVHTLSASGGTDKMSTYGSFGYLDQTGTQVGQAYTRYNANLTVDITPKDWLKMGGSINASWSEQDYGMSTTGASSGSAAGSIYKAAKNIYQFAVPYDSTGERIIYPGGYQNVYTVIGEEELSTHERQMFRAIGSFHGILDFGEIFRPLEGLNYRVNFGPDFRNWREGVYIDGESVVRLGGTSYARLKNRRDFSWTLDNIITYNKEYGIHSFGLTLLQTASKWNYESSSMSAENIPKASYLWNQFSSVDITDSDYSATMSSGINDRQLTSYMARVNYTLLSKYLLTASGRYDGASQLAEGHKWAFFPSLAVGWRINQEDFLSTVNWIDQLKLRLGMGTTGNSSVSPYGTLSDLQDFYVPFGGSDNVQGYAVNEPNYTSSLNYLPNEDLSWEKTTQYNIGIDFAVFRGRIGGTIDIYRSFTNDLIMNMTIPTVTGYKYTNANVGQTSNKGIDITINTINIQAKDFQWASSINTAWQKDQIEKLAYGKNDMVDNEWFIGEALNVQYNVDADGLWQEEDAEEMAQFNENGHDFEVGMVKPIDQNGDYTIDDDDRIVLGNSNPRITFGFNNTFTYKGVELNIAMYGRFKYLYSTKGQYQGGIYNQSQLDYWTPDNTDAEYQKPIYSQSGGDAYYSLIGYKDGSYLKLRNVSLGYNLPSKITDRLKIQNLKIYAQGKNLGMIYSAISFMDMDTRTSTYNRGFTFGVDVTF